MKVSSLFTILIIISAISVSIFVSGCTDTRLSTMDIKLPQRQASAQNPANANNMSAQKFHQGSYSNEPAATDPALLEKVSKLQEDLIAEQQKNSELIRVNTSLEERFKSSEDKLAQSEKELNEANDLLVKMRIELANWKTDVLGFREEMREANIAQLEALYKVLTILGADVNQEDFDGVQ